MTRTKARGPQRIITRALRAAQDADPDIASYVISEELGEVRVYTNSDVAAASKTSIDAAVEDWKRPRGGLHIPASGLSKTATVSGALGSVKCAEAL